MLYRLDVSGQAFDRQVGPRSLCLEAAFFGFTHCTEKGDFALVIGVNAHTKIDFGRPRVGVERLGDAESQFRNGRLSVAEFVAQIAGSDLFQRRLQRMAPLRAATAAYLALLGRAAQPAEVSRFLATRAADGQQAALEAILNSREYASAFGTNTVPYLRGLATQDGIPLTTVNRTASLYSGNAGLNPAPGAKI